VRCRSCARGHAGGAWPCHAQASTWRCSGRCRWREMARRQQHASPGPGPGPVLVLVQARVATTQTCIVNHGLPATRSTKNISPAADERKPSLAVTIALLRRWGSLHRAGSEVYLLRGSFSYGCGPPCATARAFCLPITHCDGAAYLSLHLTAACACSICSWY